MKKFGVLLALTLLLVAFSPSTVFAWSEYQRMRLGGVDYYYTPSLTNAASAKSQGYISEGFVGYVQDTPESGTEPLYQAYNLSKRTHIYTVDQNEYNNLPSGWTKEGVSAYVADSLSDNTKPLYRIRLIGNRWLYTSDEAEKNYVVSQGNYYEGIHGYVYKTAPVMVDTYPKTYSDGRPYPLKRQTVLDAGRVLIHGSTNDVNGARDAYLYEENGTYYMTYDGLTSKWAVNLATSTDLINWTKQGMILDETVSCGCYGTIHKVGSDYVMYYLGSNSTLSGGVPNIPYNTRKAHSSSITGPWTKDGDVFSLQSYYLKTATPGPIIEHNGEYLMFFSSANNSLKRTIGIARSSSPDGPWAPDTSPALPVTEQIENASLFYQDSDSTWYMFVNHVGINSNGEYTDSVWVYWSTDPTSWSTSDKALVVDGLVSWSKVAIGLPTVVRVNDKLAILYDGNTTSSQDHLNRDIGLAWINLPIIK